MRFFKFTIIIIIIGVFAYSQNLDENTNYDIEHIKITSKVNAMEDFTIAQKIIWSGVSFFTLDYILSYSLQLAATYGLPAKLPPKRLKQISSKSIYYQNIYTSKYISTIKWQRLKYSFALPCIMIATVPFVIVAMDDDAK